MATTYIDRLAGVSFKENAPYIKELLMTSAQMKDDAYGYDGKFAINAGDLSLYIYDASFSSENTGHFRKAIPEVDGATLELANGKMKIKDGGVTESKIADSSISKAKIKSDAKVVFADDEQILKSKTLDCDSSKTDKDIIQNMPLSSIAKQLTSQKNCKLGVLADGSIGVLTDPPVINSVVASPEMITAGSSNNVQVTCNVSKGTDAISKITIADGTTTKEITTGVSEGGVFSEMFVVSAATTFTVAVYVGTVSKATKTVRVPVSATKASINVSATPNSVRLGDATEVAVKAIVAKGTNDIAQIDFVVGGTTRSKTTGVSSGGTFTENFVLSQESDAKIIATDVEGLKSEISMKIAAYADSYTAYFGTENTGMITIQNVTTKNYATSISLSNDKVVYKYPAILGELTSIRKNGIESIESWTKTTEISGGLTYNVYKMTYALTDAFNLSMR